MQKKENLFAILREEAYLSPYRLLPRRTGVGTVLARAFAFEPVAEVSQGRALHLSG
jgi:hypothetical protein